VGSRAGLDAVLNRKIPSPVGDSNNDHPACSQSLYLLLNQGKKYKQRNVIF
jgi:hypothetical protein